MNIYAPNKKPVHLQPIRSIQTYLRDISRLYPEIPVLIPDGIYGPETTEAVKQFQKTFGLPVIGDVDMNTWDLLLYVHDEICKKTGASEPVFPVSFFTDATECPTCIMVENDNGVDVLFLQVMLYAIAEDFDNIRKPQLTGQYDKPTITSVQDFQRATGLQETGKLDRQTWNKLVKFYNVYGVDRGPAIVPYQTGLYECR